MKFPTKLIFFLKKPRIIVIQNNLIAEAVFNLLSKYFKVGKFGEKSLSFFDILKNEIFLIPGDFQDFPFLFKNSSQPILLINDAGESDDIIKLVKKLSDNGYLVLNYDNSEIRKLKNDTISKVLTFGFQEGADVRGTDINSENGLINFKLNYRGGFVPVWLKLPSEGGIDEKEIIYPNLATASIGIILGLNLVEISQALR